MPLTIVINVKDTGNQELDRIVKTIEQIGDEAETQQSRFSSFVGVVKAGALGAIGVLGTAVSTAAIAGFDLNNSMEQASARIQAFTKDSAATADILALVKERAAVTPFAFKDMTDSAAALLPVTKASGASLEELLEISEVLAASNPAEGLAGAAFALKEATSGDFTSVIERFNLPRQRLNELKEQGVPALEAVTIAMKELGLDTDLVAGLANTAEGRWSTFLDTLSNIAGTVTQPIFDAFSSQLGQLQVVLDANMPAIQGVAVAIANDLGAAINWSINVGLPGLIAAWAYVQPAIVFVQDLIATFAALWATNSDTIVTSAQQAWGQIYNIISDAVALISAILAGIAAFIVNNQNELLAIFSATWNLIVSVIQTGADLLQGIIQTLLKLVQGDFSGAWESIQQFSATFVLNLLNILRGLGTSIVAIFDLLLKQVGSSWAEFSAAAITFGKNIIDGIIGGVSSGIQALRDIVVDAAMSALNAAKEVLGISSPSKIYFEQIGKPIVQGAIEGIKDRQKAFNTALNDVFTPSALNVRMPQIRPSQGVQAATSLTNALNNNRVSGNATIRLELSENLKNLVKSSVKQEMTLTAQVANLRGRFG